jgi:hypothetical protein
MFFSAQNYKAQIPQQKHDRCHDNRPQRHENSHLGGQYHVLRKACVNLQLTCGEGDGRLMLPLPIPNWLEIEDVSVQPWALTVVITEGDALQLSSTDLVKQ